MKPSHTVVQKIALITGASRGLGRVLAGFLAKQGYALIVMARNETDLHAAAKEFAAAGVPVVSILGDVSVPRDRLRLLEAAKRYGRIDLLVNNASDLGDTPLPPLENASRDTFLRVFDVNTLAAELKDREVSVVSVDPGDMRTQMHQDAYPGQDISDRPLPDVTLPFWAWLLSQPPMKVSGMRYQAQAAVWEVAA